jgi:Tfp pilus assembly protein PilN
MSEDISLLPEELRAPEAKKSNVSRPEQRMPMHLPIQEVPQIIEIDEGEEVKGSRSFFSNITEKLKSVWNGFQLKLMKTDSLDLPAKAPPDAFFTPLNVGDRASKAASSVPLEEPGVAPLRRVVVKRVHKPVHVSFLHESSETAIDLPKRRFTLFLLVFVFCSLFGGSFALLEWQTALAQTNLRVLQARTQDAKKRAEEQQAMWVGFQDLEPRLQALTQLLDRHVAPTLVLDRLAAATLRDVFYTSLTLTPDGSLTLSVVAPSYETAARQIVAIRNAGFASRVEAMGYQGSYSSQARLEKVTFQMRLQLQAQVLQAGQKDLISENVRL